MFICKVISMLHKDFYSFKYLTYMKYAVIYNHSQDSHHNLPPLDSCGSPWELSKVSFSKYYFFSFIT